MGDNGIENLFTISIHSNLNSLVDFDFWQCLSRLPEFQFKSIGRLPLWLTGDPLPGSSPALALIS